MYLPHSIASMLFMLLVATYALAMGVPQVPFKVPGSSVQRMEDDTHANQLEPTWTFRDLDIGLGATITTDEDDPKAENDGPWWDNLWDILRFPAIFGLLVYLDRNMDDSEDDPDEEIEDQYPSRISPPMHQVQSKEHPITWASKQPNK